MSDKKSDRESQAYFFEMAIEQRSMINLYFMVDRCQFTNLLAPCVMIKNNHFVVRAEIDKIEDKPIIWGTEVNGYFTVRDVNPVHCHFSTRLARIYNGPLNSLYLVFRIPAHIDHNQRRFSRRINIDEENAENFWVWHGKMEGGDFESLPQLEWKDLESTVCELGEISSSGLRLEVPEKAPICTQMVINDPILFKGNFGTATKQNTIFVLGNIVRKMPNPELEGIMNIGCQFHSWRKVDSPSKRTWFRSDPREGVGIIAEWIARNFRSISI